ncbi:MAG: TonB-dependent receptor plug domain-containing protein [candidate division Zixibacteria bacterium]|nr:TonB-dependent receptor plug domain-containing protein [candidate division Zixibacteria bacterium]
MKKVSIFSLAIILLFASALTWPAFSQTTEGGKITGHIVDKETGEFLLGATVMLENTTKGTFADLDGSYTLSDVSPGTHTLVIQLMGYSKLTVQQVNVKAGEVTKIDATLKPEPIMGQEVVVIAKSLENTEASLLKRRQRASSISDAISAERLSQTGSGDAADALSRVTGASVVGGKYVYVRGLGERYSSAQLNGTDLPSADPDKKAFQMDLLPANLLENITVIKSFTPDQPGNFSGGIIDIGTKSFPETFTMKISASGSYNSRANFNQDFITYTGGDMDWLGFDDGARDIPDPIKNGDIPDISFAFNDSETAHELDAISKSFNNVMSPTDKRPPFNGSLSFSIGNQTSMMDRPFGYLASFSYNRKYSFYDDGQVNRYRLSGNVGQAATLTNDFELNDTRSTEEVLWGGLFTASYKLNPHNVLDFNYILTQSGDSETRLLTGRFFDGNLPEDATYETRVLKYTERTLNSFQLSGKHNFGGHDGVELNWGGTYSINTQDEPDARFFSDHFIVSGNDTSYSITPSHYKLPQRYFRDLQEDNYGFDTKMEIPFHQWSGLSSKLSFGGSVSYKTREYREQLYEIHNQDINAYDGDPEDFFGDGNTGIIGYDVNGDDTTYIFGNYVVNASELRSNYDGEQTIAAGFAMLDLPLSNKLRFIGGSRFEKTKIEVSTLDPRPEYKGGELDNNDFLPSLSLIYRLNDNMNLRTAYGRTLARPTFRELAPYPSWDFANGFFFTGNDTLKITLINNFDVRWEWFTRPGEILATSIFYKTFENPIERVIKNDNGEIQYQNVDEATVYGAEFEARKRLDFLGTFFERFQLGCNLSLVRSIVDISAEEMEVIREYDPDADNTRPLQGQSPYLLNLDLTYDNRETKTMASLSYSVFGERLSEVSLGGTPDIYEQPRPDMNFVFNQNLWGSIDMKFSVKNILDSSVEKLHTFKGADYIYQSYKRGRTVSLGFSYNIL